MNQNQHELQGNCLSPLPPEADLGIDDTAALLLPQKDGQCLITFSDALLAIQSTSGDMLLMDNLYFRYACSHMQRISASCLKER